MKISVLKAKTQPLDVDIFTTKSTEGASFSIYDPASRENYRLLREQSGVDVIVTLHQQHSADIVKVTPQNMYAVAGTSADGLFTAERGIGLGILTADCYPVMIAGEFCCCALHCGWRGTLKGIIGKAAEFFTTAGDRPVYAYIGAGISADAFEVKEDFIGTVSAFMEPASYLRKEGARWWFNLPQLLSDQLVGIGVGRIEASGECTFSGQGFYSYRRDGMNAGRMVSVIHRKPAL